jgi:hypothetical protein
MKIKLISCVIFCFLNTNGNSQLFLESDFNGFPIVSSSSIAVGDYNNDGFIDIAVMGYNGTTTITQVYKNNGDGTFTKTADLKGLNNGNIVWADINGDNALDLIVTGIDQLNSGNEYTIIYINKGINGFEELKTNDLTGVYTGSLNLADIDHNGVLDIIITGITNSSPKFYYYVNESNGRFANKNQELMSTLGSCDVSDYNNDGNFDLILTMMGDVLANTKIYNYDSTGNFMENRNIKIDSVATYSHMYAKWIDFNNDGYTDILMSGVGDYDKKIIEKISLVLRLNFFKALNI